MIADLRAHEALHEGIATTWEGNLRTNLTGLSVTVPNRTIAAFRSAVQAEWNGWLAQHQADQTAIDPYIGAARLLRRRWRRVGEHRGEGGGGSELTGLDEEPTSAG